MSSRGGRQDTAREAHVEDVARVFSSAYAGKNTVGFCTFDRDANAFSLAQAIVKDDDEDVLKLFFRTSGADVVYCSSEFKAAIEKMSDARATTTMRSTVFLCYYYCIHGALITSMRLLSRSTLRIASPR